MLAQVPNPGRVSGRIPAEDSRAIADLILGYRKAKILFTAVSLGLFGLIESGVSSLPDLCRKAGVLHRPAEILLDALVAMGYLRKRGPRYENTAVSRAFLVSGRRGYLGDNLRYQDLSWGNWGRLGEVLRTGRVKAPLFDVLTGEGGSFIDDYIGGMANIAREPAREVAAALPLVDPETMLDVGAGPGAFSRALLERHPGLKSTALDLPRTLRLTRRFLAVEARAGRASFKAGDYNSANFGSELYDLVLLSHVTHDEGPAQNQALLRRAFRALKPGGTVAVHDFVLSEDRSGPLFASVFAVHMLVGTNAGRVYTRGEYEDWMRKAGFKGLRRWAICPGALNGTTLLAGKKP